MSKFLFFSMRHSVRHLTRDILNSRPQKVANKRTILFRNNSKVYIVRRPLDFNPFHYLSFVIDNIRITMMKHSIKRNTARVTTVLSTSFYAATVICSAVVTYRTQGVVSAFALKQQTQTAFGTSTNTNTNNVHTPVGKDGEGAYSAATKGCFDVIDAATPLVLNEIARIGQQPATITTTTRDDVNNAAFHIADYGTADAGTSLGLLSKIVKAVRDDDNNEKEIVIHYEDQKDNEWKSVFNHALGYKSVTDAYGNKIETPYNLGKVFIEANGVGFHSQCYPSSSINLGLSFTAMHWLSSSPSSLRGLDMMHAARCSVSNDSNYSDGNIYAAETKQADQDWYNILQARSKELKQGGTFVCINFCISKEGYFLGQTEVGASMWDSFDSAWNKLADGADNQNLITEEERLNVSFPNYYRTTQEFMQGVEKCPDLRLISAEEKIVRCPYREQYISSIHNKDSTTKNAKTMTPKEYAKSFVPTTRTWSHSTFKAALNNNRTDEEKEKILKQFWCNYEDLVAREPEKHGMDYVHSYLVIEKL